jgi:phosphonoacetaldehyde dehydrogenase
MNEEATVVENKTQQKNTNHLAVINTSCYVAGKKIVSENTLEVRSPYDQRLVGTVALANASHAEQAIEAALKGGLKLTRYDRFSILDKAFMKQAVHTMC